MGTTGLAAAGWYQDPTGRHVYRWWDGAGWTDRVGDGAAEFHDPFGAVMHPTPSAEVPAWAGPPASEPARRSRVGWIVAGSVIGGLVVIVLGVVVLVALIRVANGPIVDEDFESGAGRFSTDSDRFVDLVAVDGTYQVTIKDASAPQEARTFFEPARDAIEVTTTARFLDRPAGSFAAAGLSCYASTYAGYLFVVGTDGYWAIVTKSTADDAGTVLSEGDVDLPDGPLELSFECRGGGSSPTELVGRVGGEGGHQVSTTDPDGYDQFRAAGFFVAAEEADTVVAFDDMVVRPLG